MLFRWCRSLDGRRGLALSLLFPEKGANRLRLRSFGKVEEELASCRFGSRRIPLIEVEQADEVQMGTFQIGRLAERVPEVLF